MSTIIEAEHLSKQYQLGGPASGYGTVRDLLARLWRRPAASPVATNKFWALEDVSFSVVAGETVGIIGRNGAGKSTLLKILSRITAPTTGQVRLRGRVASLLEVGTGFHGELTGRENIFLNGAILGMTRVEIRQRFDEIVAFAEVDQFLDTPVKRYSSGMYVRLAFAVAAHLQPEILVVDEVLAVGDASFQKKCLGKMEKVAEGGRTVLFVSHNMAAVARLCRRAILLKQGRVVTDGPVSTVIKSYVGGVAGESPSEVDFQRQGRVPGSEDVRLLSARVRSEGMDAGVVDIRRPVLVDLDYQVLRERYPIHPNILVYNDESELIFISSDAVQIEASTPKRPGLYRATVTIPGNFLSEGMFSLDLAMSTHDPHVQHVYERGVLAFHVHDPGLGDSARGKWGGPFPGAVRPLLPWATQRIDVETP